MLYDLLDSVNSELDSRWGAFSDAYLNYIETYFNNNDLVGFMVTMYIVHNMIAFVYSSVNICMHYFQVCLDYKIRPTDDNDYKLVRLAFLDLVKRLFTSIPMWYILYYMLYFSGVRFLKPLPSKETSLYQFLLMLITTDTSYYWMHRWMHEVPWMYKIHKVHHEFKATSAITTLYAHPLETIFGTFATTLLGAILFMPHGAIFCIYYTIRLIEAFEVHSGYIFPFSIVNSISFIFFGADRHDFHHSHNVGCFGTWTCFWDRLCGTDEYYNRWRKKKAELKAKQEMMANDTSANAIINNKEEKEKKQEVMEIPSKGNREDKVFPLRSSLPNQPKHKDGDEEGKINFELDDSSKGSKQQKDKNCLGFVNNELVDFTINAVEMNKVKVTGKDKITDNFLQDKNFETVNKETETVENYKVNDNNNNKNDNRSDKTDLKQKQIRRLGSRRHSKTFYDEFFGTDTNDEEVKENNEIVEEIEKELMKERKEKLQRQYERRDSLRKSLSNIFQGVTDPSIFSLRTSTNASIDKEEITQDEEIRRDYLRKGSDDQKDDDEDSIEINPEEESDNETAPLSSVFSDSELSLRSLLKEGNNPIYCNATTI